MRQRHKQTQHSEISPGKGERARVRERPEEVLIPLGVRDIFMEVGIPVLGLERGICMKGEEHSRQKKQPGD